MSQSKLKQFAIDLHGINAIKFGEFKTKIGIMTPVYCDLRVIISYPKMMKTLSELIIEAMKDKDPFDVICGVPYTALPIATAVSMTTGIPMVMRRKETKAYGTKKKVEGAFKLCDNCLIIEDVVTSGSSIMETVTDLRQNGICCQDAIVLLNRQQGGESFLASKGIKMHALLTLTELMGYLREAYCVDDVMMARIDNYLAKTRVNMNVLKAKNRLLRSFEDRILSVTNDVTKQLFETIIRKKSTLCVAADLTDGTAILNLAEEVGPHICMLKTHIDIVDDFDLNFIKCLKEIAERHDFLLCEDRKFADIGNTVKNQFNDGVYKISSWSNFVTCHSLMGKGTLDALENKQVGIFLLAEASSDDSIIDGDYTKATLNLLPDCPSISGFVCQSPLALEHANLLQLTPGCHLESLGDNLSQTYSTPEVVVKQKGADVVVVGRGITKAENPGEEALKYKNALWECYERRLR